MRYAGKHFGSFCQLALNAIAHLTERNGGLAHFRRPFDGNITAVATKAKITRRCRQSAP